MFLVLQSIMKPEEKCLFSPHCVEVGFMLEQRWKIMSHLINVDYCFTVAVSKAIFSSVPGLFLVTFIELLQKYKPPHYVCSTFCAFSLLLYILHH